MEAKLIKVGNHYDLYYRDEENDSIVGIASTDNTFELKLSLKNCEAIANGYDLDELADERANQFMDGKDHFYSFKEGFQKALAILGDKKYSEKDMRVVYNDGMSNIDSDGDPVDNPDNDFYDTIQSLQQTKWDVVIEKENVMNDYNGNISLGARYKLDSDGCLILKSFKTE